jgi:hypothetical protein
MTSALNEMTDKAERGARDSSSAMNQQIESAVLTLENVSRKISEVIGETANRMTVSSEQVNGAFNVELIAATKTFQTVSDRMASRIEEAVGAITNGLMNEVGSIGGKVSQAAIKAGEESRAKVVSAGADLAQTLSGVGQELLGAVIRWPYTHSMVKVVLTSF